MITASPPAAPVRTRWSARDAWIVAALAVAAFVGVEWYMAQFRAGVIPQFSQRIRLFDTDKIPLIIEEGERAAEEQLPYLRRLLGNGSAERRA